MARDPIYSILQLVTLPQRLHFLFGHEFCRALILLVVRAGSPFFATFHRYHSFTLLLRKPWNAGSKAVAFGRKHSVANTYRYDECMFVDAGVMRR
jgi:hypothetical protein